MEIVTYLPRLPVRRAGGRGSNCALFPSYLFVRAKRQRIAEIDAILCLRLRTSGIGHVVEFGGAAASVAEEIIDELQSRENGKGLIEKTEINLQEGDRVVIISGPLRNHKATVDRALSGRNVWLLVDDVSFASKAVVSASNLALLNASTGS